MIETKGLSQNGFFDCFEAALLFASLRGGKRWKGIENSVKLPEGAAITFFRRPLEVLFYSVWTTNQPEILWELPTRFPSDYFRVYDAA